ncbi:MAG: hemerythrin domain-containing protein [Armatimonadota bacterium]
MALQCDADEMTAYLERNIKDLLTEFPALGDVLSAFNIGCVTCAVGTCAMKDIVQYHYLPEAQMQELMVRITSTLQPDGGDEDIVRQQATPCVFTYSPPLQSLVDEHTLIKRWLALIPELVADIDLEAESGRQLVLNGIDFIRAYADRFHHAKEEEILFTRFDANQEIIRVMLDDHTTGRNHVRAMLEAVEQRDTAKLAEHLLGYRQLLTEHITKENEILYPWMDRRLSPPEVESLAQEFSQADSRVAPDMTGQFTQFIVRLEARFGRR